MERNYLKEKLGRSFVFIIALFLLILLGLIQPHASEKVVNYANGLFQNKLKSSIPVMLGSSNKLPDIMSKVRDLCERLRQLKQGPKSNNPAFSPKFYPPQFPDKLIAQKGQLHLQKTNAKKQVLRDRVIKRKFHESQTKKQPSSKFLYNHYTKNVPPQFREMIKLQPGNIKSKQMNFMRDIHKFRKGKGSVVKNKIIMANGGGSISGTVTDTNGAGIEDVGVDVYDSDGNWSYGWSDMEGHYTVNDLPTGDYYVGTWNDQGYIDGWYQNAVPWEGDPPPVNVVAPNDTPNIDFVLAEGGSISGTVKDTSSVGIGNVEVEVYDSNGNWISRYGWSDMEGHYTVNGLPTGDYYVQTWNYQGYIDEWYDDKDPWEGDPPPVNVVAPNDTPNIDFVLAKGGSISGTVKDKNGVGIGDVEVDVVDSSGNWIDCYDWSDSEGHYTVDGLPTGDYYVQTWNDQGYIDEWYDDKDPWEGDPPPVSVVAPNPTPNINFALEMGGSIYGVITECGEPSIIVPDVRIYAEDWDTWNWMAYDWSDSEGHYTLNGLPTGNYRICVDTFGTKYLDMCHDTPVSVTAGSNTPLDLCLEKGGSVSGTITCENCSGGIPIVAFALSEELEPDFSNLDKLISLGYIYGHDESSAYSLGALPYDTQIWTYAWWSQQFNFPPDCDDYFGSYEGNPVTLTSESANLSGVDITLKEVCCSISGKVYEDATGTGIENLTVVALDFFGSDYRETQTDDFGNYEIPGFAPGKYLVAVLNDTYPKYPYVEFYNDAPTYDSDKIELVEVIAESTTENIDFGMPLAQNISGNISGVDSGTGVCIYTYDSGFWGMYGTTCNVGPGDYTISGLHPDGSYMVFTLLESLGYLYYDNTISPFLAEPVTPPRDDIDFNLNLPPGCIVGQFTDAATSGPISDLSVGLFDSETEKIETMTWSDSSGGYTFDYLPPKTYQVKVFSDNYCSQTKKADVVGGCIEVDFQLTECPITDMNAVAGEGSGRVGDTVTIPITIENFQNQSYGIEAYIGFDNTKLELSDISSGDVNAEFIYYPLWICNLEGGVYFTAFFDLLAPGSGTLANLDFKILSGTPGDEIALPLDADPAGETTDGKIIILPDITSTTTTIPTTTTSIPECTSDAYCDDGLFCNGAETCVGGRCRSGSDPCPDDELFCNGEESCDEEDDVCLSSGDPCPDDGLFCNGEESCDEGSDECLSSGDPCTPPEVCDEESDICREPPLPCAISIEPETAEVVSGETLSFAIIPEGDCDDPNYEWSVESDIGSAIDQNGSYTAGINSDFFNEANDVVRVVDHGNGDITVEATVTVSWGCSLLQIYGEGSEEVKVLRSFRDNVLSQTPEGQEIIRLYYEWSPAIVKAMEEDEEFKEEIRALVDKLLPLMRAGAE